MAGVSEGKVLTDLWDVIADGVPCYTSDVTCYILSLYVQFTVSASRAIA